MISEPQTEQQLAPQPMRRRYPLLIVGTILTFGGIAFAFLPLLLAFAGTQPGHNMFNEGDSGSGAAAIWLMILTLPVGGGAALGGIVTLIVGIIRALRIPLPNSDDPTARNQMIADRAKILAFLTVPALLITSPVIAFVANNMIVGGPSGIITVTLFMFAAAAAIAYAIRLTIQSGRKALLGGVLAATAIWTAIILTVMLPLALYFSTNTL